MLSKPASPSLGELTRGLPAAALKKAKRALRRNYGQSGLGVVLDRNLPAIYSCVTGGAPLGIATRLGHKKKAVILLFFTGSTERPYRVRRLRRAAAVHRLFHPGHQIIFLCNTAREEELCTEAGEMAVQINQNIFVSDQTFRPLAPRPRIYDAIYNARLAPVKRHELTHDIASCVFTYYHAGPETVASDEAVRQRHRATGHDHIFLNELRDNGVPIPLTHEQINEVYAESEVGLCLSAREGAMLVSMEYLLAGLPIVSTPSLGGRDVYFDDDYCLIVEPNPRSVAEGVRAMKSRNIPRDYIAARTREKVNRDRQRLTALINELQTAAGLEPGALDNVFDRPQILFWLNYDRFLSELD